MTLRYASKIAVGDKVRFMGLPDLTPLTVATVATLSDGTVAIGYAERDGRGGVYRPNEILQTAEDSKAGSRIHRVLGPDDALIGDGLTWEEAIDAAEMWQKAHPLVADLTIRDVFGNSWIVWDADTNA